MSLENPYGGFEEEPELVDSPLVASLREHFAKHYSSTADPSRPFSGRNQVAPPLNLDLLNSATVKKLSEDP